MSNNTIIQQGSFTSDGADKIIRLRSDVDWMWVYNYTQIGATNNVGVQYYWQRNMTAPTGIYWLKTGGGNDLQMDQLASGFTLVNSAENPVGNAVAWTSSTGAAQPVVSTASTTGLSTGTVVRVMGDNPGFMGMDYEVDTVVANTSFRMRYALTNSPGAGASGGFYRIIKYDPIFYPRRRFITNITQAAQAVVTLSVTHQMTIGQEIRFQIPTVFGMTQLDNQIGTIVSVSTANNTVTVDIDTTSYSAFTFPAAVQPFTFAQMVPVGMNTGEAIDANRDILFDATENAAFIGMVLSGGADLPGGDAADVMFWTAGKSFSVITV